MSLQMLVYPWKLMYSIFEQVLNYASESMWGMFLVSAIMAAAFLLNIRSGYIFLSKLQFRTPGNEDVSHEIGREVVRKLSPINIVLRHVEKERFATPLFWNYYDAMPQAVLLENNGTTLIMRLECGENVPYLSGAGLVGKYFFKEAVFKWASFQSEHAIDSRKFALEMQVLHVNCSIRDKAKYLTVSYLFGMEHHNNNLVQIVENLEAIATPGSSIEMPPFDLESIIHPFTTCYYSYFGTYDNGEMVLPTQWLIYSRIFGVSHEQLSQFGRLSTPLGRVQDLQPVGDRQIHFHSISC